MTKAKILIITLIIGLLLLFLPNIVNAAGVDVTRNIYSNNGSMKFSFSGLTLDTTHEYEYGLTKTTAAEVGTWHLITEYTANTAVVDVMTTTRDLREVINAVDTGYITIRDKSDNTVVLQPYSVDLKIPFLSVTNYTVIPNGKDLDKANIQIALRCASNSKAYYQYEKITDTAIINKFKEIKAANGDYTQLQSMLKTTAPSSNWTTWGYWNGYDSSAGMNGYGYTQRNVSVPDTGLYYMWVYFSGNNLKNIYGYVLVDNLQPDIVLEGISLPKTEKVELGKTLTLTPTFNPTNATNKIVTWKSSDESVATIDNGGKITPKKVGSTIITVTSQDGNKTATCTVTVVETPTTIAVGSISLPSTEKVELGKTLTLTPTFNPANATNKIVTWKSSDESVATVDNSGKVTPKKVGSAIITVTSQDGNKTATCTVTVVQAANNNNNNNGNNNNGSNNNGGTTDKKDDTTLATGKLPQTGVGVGLISTIISVIGISIFMFFKYNKYRGI